MLRWGLCLNREIGEKCGQTAFFVAVVVVVLSVLRRRLSSPADGRRQRIPRIINAAFVIVYILRGPVCVCVRVRACTRNYSAKFRMAHFAIHTKTENFA